MNHSPWDSSQPCSGPEVPGGRGELWVKQRSHRVKQPLQLGSPCPTPQPCPSALDGHQLTERKPAVNPFRCSQGPVRHSHRSPCEHCKSAQGATLGAHPGGLDFSSHNSLLLFKTAHVPPAHGPPKGNHRGDRLDLHTTQNHTQLQMQPKAAQGPRHQPCGGGPADSTLGMEALLGPNSLESTLCPLSRTPSPEHGQQASAQLVYRPTWASLTELRARHPGVLLPRGTPSLLSPCPLGITTNSTP